MVSVTPTESNDAATDWVERVAVVTSLACLVHCLALPFVLAALPALAATFPVSETFHVWILLIAVPASGFALLNGGTFHHVWTPSVIGALGLALLVIGALVYGGQAPETPVTVAGGVFLAVAHTLNWRLRHAFHPG